MQHQCVLILHIALYINYYNIFKISCVGFGECKTKPKHTKTMTCFVTCTRYNPSRFGQCFMVAECRPTRNPLSSLSLFVGETVPVYCRRLVNMYVVTVWCHRMCLCLLQRPLQSTCQKIPQTYLLAEKILIRLNCLKPYKHSEFCSNRQRLICIYAYMDMSLEIVAFVKLNVPAHSQA